MTDRGRGLDPEGPAPSESASGTERDPKNVVPICVWLASTESDLANGRVFSATGHRISLFEEPVQERILRLQEPMADLEALFALWPKTFDQGGYPRNSIRSGDQVSASGA